MKIVIAPDSMKECASAEVVAAAIARGVRRAVADAVVETLPLADGGEGTASALVSATGGRMVTCSVRDPMGRVIEARYGMLGDGLTAVVEMAEASGLALVPPALRDPGRASTRGTGELMVAALEAGAQRILVGLGGSATNDLGAGMALALGYRLLDGKGRELAPGGLALAGMASIDDTGVHSRLREAEIIGLCDVTNPLTGPNGASHVYGPQKGADDAMVRGLDEALGHAVSVLESHFGMEIAPLPGAGAAGGLGAGIVAFAKGALRPGLETIADVVGLGEAILGADLVITAEGRFDAQSLNGKLPVAVARRASAEGVPVIVLAGQVDGDVAKFQEAGIHTAVAVTPEEMPLSEALRRVEENLERCAEAVVRRWVEEREGRA